MYMPLHKMQLSLSKFFKGDSVFCSVIYYIHTCIHTYTQTCMWSSGTASGDPLISVEFSASCLWAPPVAIQFSVLSQYTHVYIHTYTHTYTHICEARAPPVATLSFQLNSSFPVSGYRLWRFSFLLCHSPHLHTYTYIRAYLCTYTHTYIHT